MARLTGRAGIVTGASNGIGAAIVDRFVAEGARVLATDIDETAGQALAARHPGKVTFMRHDAASEADWRAVWDVATAQFGRVQMLVNNAGLGTHNDIETTTLAQWRSIMAVNLDGVFLGTQLAVLHMKERGGGSIVNISSVGGIVGTSNLVAYSASKAGVRLLTKCVAVHCGQRKYNIRVNSVHPGLVRTRAGLEMARLATGMVEDQAEQAFASLHPIGRIGEPHEIADAALYLACDESSFVTGAELVVDGGYTAQ